MKKTHLIGLLALGGSIAALGFGCSSDPVVDDGGPSGTGGSTASGTGGTTNTGPTSSVGTGGSGGIADEGSSCADAIPMEEGMNQLGGVLLQGIGAINPAGDSDYFTFTAEAGQWVQIVTDANPDDIPEKVDTVLTLFTQDGNTQLAEVDDAFPRLSTDSEMFHRFETAGTYCLRVQEFSDWAGQTPEGEAGFTYRAVVIPVDFALYDNFHNEVEDNNTSPMATVLDVAIDDMSGQAFTRITGDFGADDDVDWFKFTVPPMSVGFGIDFMPKGIEGFGNTANPGVINIHDDNMTRIATLDLMNGSDGFSSVPLTAGADYFIEVNKEGGAAGANPFYVLKFGTAGQLNDQEQNEQANNSGMMPELASLAANTVASFFIGGNLDANDVDYWTIPAANVNVGDKITVVCSAQRAGSGVGDFTVEYLGDSAANTPLETETESATADILWSDSMAPGVSKPAATVAVAGDQFFRFSSTMDITNVDSKFYLCGIHVAAP